MARIYLDVCCFKRPFDEQRQERFRREAEAVAEILESVETGRDELVRSPALLYENARNPREDRRLAAALWVDGAAIEVEATDAAESRARELTQLGFGVLDAFHVAYAEAASATWLVTCDDDLLLLAERHGEQLRVRVASPIEISRYEDRP